MNRYAHNTNQFWPLLYQAGLTRTQLGPNIDYKVLDEGIGLTCLHSKSTRTVDDVTSEDWLRGMES
jgi:G:T/U-mismatch repair DNA glycosylase